MEKNATYQKIHYQKMTEYRIENQILATRVINSDFIDELTTKKDVSPCFWTYLTSCTSEGAWDKILKSFIKNNKKEVKIQFILFNISYILLA